MLRGSVELAAAESWGRVLTVVVGPPAPPFVLHVTVNVRTVELVVLSHPPLVVAKPTLAASVMLALFWSAFAGSSWMVGVGEAVMTTAANKKKVVESFMTRALCV
jgi:hypothetical protein